MSLSSRIWRRGHARLTGVLVTAEDAQTENPVLVGGVRGAKDRAIPSIHGDVVRILGNPDVSASHRAQIHAEVMESTALTFRP